MIKYQNSVASAVDGKPIYGAQVNVYNTADESLATIYADEAGTSPLGQPILTDQLGSYSFYVADGKYTITVMTGTVQISTTNITMVDALQLKERALLVPVNEDAGTLPSASARAGLLLGFDQITGGPTALVPNSFAGPTGTSDSAFLTLNELKDIDPALYPSPRLAALAGSDGAILNGTFTYQAGNFIEGPDVVKLNSVPLTTGALVRVREAKAVPYAVPYNRILSDKSLDRITLNDFGADAKPAGADNPDWDTAAFQRAVDFCANYLTATQLPGDPNPIRTGPAIKVPAARYTLVQPITANSPTAGRFAFRGEDKNGTVLRLAPGIYAVQPSARIESTYFADMTVMGGKGFFRHTHTGDNVSQKHIFENLLLYSYSGAAISSDATDFPYITIQNSIFAGGGTGDGSTRGICLGGLLDKLYVAHNAFLSNDIGIVVGPVHSGSWHLDDNDHISAYGPDRTWFDIWIRPHDGTVSAASPPGAQFFRSESGMGTGITNSKFGNEGITSFERKAPKILIAAALWQGGVVGTPPPRDVAMPDPAWQDGTDGRHYFSGLNLAGNTFATANTRDANGVAQEGADASIMLVRCNNIDKITWEESNTYLGSFRHAVEHSAPDLRLPSAQNTNWNINLPVSGVPTTRKFTNSPVGILRDPGGTSGDPYAVNPFLGTDPTRAVYKSVTSPDGWTVNGGVTKAATTNIDGQADATRLTFDGTPASFQVVGADPMLANMGRAGFIKGSYRLPPDSPIQRLQLFFNSGGRDIRSLTMNLSATGRWETLAITCPLMPDSQYGLATFFAIGAVSGSIMDLGDFEFSAGKTA